MRVPGSQFCLSYQDVYAFIRVLRQVCAVANRGVGVTRGLTLNLQESVLGTNEAAEVRSFSRTEIVTLLLTVLLAFTA